VTPAATVKTHLVSLGPVTSLVGQRVYVEVLPQHATLPAIRIQRISELEDAHLRGARAIRQARVQVDAIAATLEAATAVSDAAHGDGAGSGLSGFQGDVAGQEVLAVLPVDTRSDYEAGELRQYRVSRDYLISLR
jgi:hypothetical protein